MKKLGVCILLIFVMLCSLSACGEAKETKGNNIVSEQNMLPWD